MAHKNERLGPSPTIALFVVIVPTLRSNYNLLTPQMGFKPALGRGGLAVPLACTLLSEVQGSILPQTLSANILDTERFPPLHVPRKDFSRVIVGDRWEGGSGKLPELSGSALGGAGGIVGGSSVEVQLMRRREMPLEPVFSRTRDTPWKGESPTGSTPVYKFNHQNGLSSSPPTIWFKIRFRLRHKKPFGRIWQRAVAVVRSSPGLLDHLASLPGIGDGSSTWGP